MMRIDTPDVAGGFLPPSRLHLKRLPEDVKRPLRPGWIAEAAIGKRRHLRGKASVVFRRQSRVQQRMDLLHLLESQARQIGPLARTCREMACPVHPRQQGRFGRDRRPYLRPCRMNVLIFVAALRFFLFFHDDHFIDATVSGWRIGKTALFQTKRQPASVLALACTTPRIWRPARCRIVRTRLRTVCLILGRRARFFGRGGIR